MSSNWWRFVTDRDYSSPFVSPRCDMSAIERRPLHLYDSLWRHYFRTRNIDALLSPVYLSCLRVVTSRHPFWQPVTDRFDFLGCTCTRIYCGNYTYRYSRLQYMFHTFFYTNFFCERKFCNIWYPYQWDQWINMCGHMFIKAWSSEYLHYTSMTSFSPEKYSGRRTSSKWYSHQILWEYMYNIPYITRVFRTV